MRGERNVLSIFERNSFFLQQCNAAVDNGLVQLEVGNTIAKQTAGRLVLLEYRYLIAHQVQVVGRGQSCRTGTDHCYFLPVTLRVMNGDIAFAEGSFGNGTLILAVGSRLMFDEVQHTGLFAEGRTDTTSEFREGIRGVEQTISQLPVALIQRIVPLWRFVAQWTSPMTERYAAVHATAGL